MNEVLLSVVNMSAKGSVVILAVLVLRLLLNRAPKAITCLLWAVVFFRLLCPFTVESEFSLMPASQPDRIREAVDQPSGIHVQVPTVGQMEHSDPEQHRQNAGPAVSPSQTQPMVSGGSETAGSGADDWLVAATLAAEWIWAGGVVALLGWALISWTRLKRSVAQAVPRGNGVYAVDELSSPFLLGIFRPRIYVPAGLNPPALDHVLAHERAHLARRDHLWKLLSWLAVALHWFNPLVWLSFHLLSQDMEQACDERATRSLSLEDRKEYSLALLELSAPRFAAGCPVAFGEVSTKDRVRRVLKGRKPSLWLAAMAVAGVVLAVVCFGPDPEGHPAARPYDPSPYEAFVHALEEAGEVRYAPEAYSSMLYPAIEDEQRLQQVCRLLVGPGQAPMEGQRQLEEQAFLLPTLTLLQDGEWIEYTLSTNEERSCLLALGREVLWVYPVGTWAQLRDVAAQGQWKPAVTVPGDEQLSLRLSTLTTGQLDQARPYDAGWNGRDMVLLADEDRLGLQVYGYADETHGSESPMVLRCGDWIGVLTGYDWQGISQNRGEIRLDVGDFDADGTREGVMIFPWGWGTGAYVEELLVLEPRADGSWSWHGFVNEYASPGAQGTDQVNRGVYGNWEAATGQFQLYDGDELLYARVWDVGAYVQPGGSSLAVSGENMLRFRADGDMILMSAAFCVGSLEYLADTEVEARLYWDGTIFLRGPYIPLGTDPVGRRTYLNNRQPVLDENYTPDAEARKIEMEKGVELVFRGQMPHRGDWLYIEAIDPAADFLYLYRSIERGKGYDRIPLPLPEDVSFDTAVPVYMGTGGGSGECWFVLELTRGPEIHYVTYDNFDYTGPEDQFDFEYRGEVSRVSLEEAGVLPRETPWERMARVTAQQLDQARPYDSSWNGRDIVLLGQEETLGVTLYGYAEEEPELFYGLLLRSGEHVTVLHEGSWGCVVMRQVMPRLFAGDYDGDGVTEGALVWLAGWGTQCNIEQLLILEPEKDGSYRYCRFPAEEWVMRDVSCTWEADTGRFRLYDGQSLLCDRVWEVAFYDENGGKTVVPVERAHGGELLHFVVEGDRIAMQTQIGVWAGTVPVYHPDDRGYEAAIRWDGTSFRREEYIPVEHGS